MCKENLSAAKSKILYGIMQSCCSIKYQVKWSKIFLVLCIQNVSINEYIKTSTCLIFFSWPKISRNRKKKKDLLGIAKW